MAREASECCQCETCRSGGGNAAVTPRLLLFSRTHDNLLSLGTDAIIERRCETIRSGPTTPPTDCVAADDASPRDGNSGDGTRTPHHFAAAEVTGDAPGIVLAKRLPDDRELFGSSLDGLRRWRTWCSNCGSSRRGALIQRRMPTCSSLRVVSRGPTVSRNSTGSRRMEAGSCCGSQPVPYTTESERRAVCNCRT